MTDEQIIKALECLADRVGCNCSECSFKSYGGCRSIVCRNTLDLINRQQMEIDILIRKKESLRNEICELQSEIERLKEFEYMYNSLLK